MIILKSNKNRKKSYSNSNNKIKLIGIIISEINFRLNNQNNSISPQP